MVQLHGAEWTFTSNSVRSYSYNIVLPYGNLYGKTPVMSKYFLTAPYKSENFFQHDFYTLPYILPVTNCKAHV